MSGTELAGLLVTPTSITTAVAYLLAALGLSSSAGLRAYLPLLALGIGSHVTAPNGQPYLQLQPDLATLGSPPVLALLGVLVVVEFLVDKVPVVDHVSDLVHTVVRPIAGALALAGIQNPISDHSQLAAALVGGALALGVHGLKAGTRAGVTATTAGIGNPVVSLIEDILVVVVSVLLVVAPLLGFLVLVAFLLVVWRVLRRVARALFGRSRTTRRPSSPIAPQLAAPSMPSTPSHPASTPSAPYAPLHAPSYAPPPVPARPYAPAPARPAAISAPLIGPVPVPVPPLPPVEATLPLPWENTWPPVGSDAPTIPTAPSSSAPTWPGWQPPHTTP